MTEESTKQMTWHKNGKRYNLDKMVHTSNSEAWKHFDAIHREKAKEVIMYVLRWPQMGSIPMELALPRTHVGPCLLSPSISPRCMLSKTQHICVVDNIMGVYMEPLIDELVHAWEEGVWTYDQATKTNFKMHVWYQYSMHDLPAYGLFCA
jgi:hypothetical protein